MKKLLFSLLGIASVCAVTAQEHPKNIVGLRAGYAASWTTSMGVATSVKHGYAVGISEDNLFTNSIREHTSEEGHDLAEFIDQRVCREVY